MIENRLSQLSNSAMQHVIMQHLFIQDGFIRCRMIHAANAAGMHSLSQLRILSQYFFTCIDALYVCITNLDK